MTDIKPDWNDAPEWANWWALNEDGSAVWFETEPYFDLTAARWAVSEYDAQYRHDALTYQTGIKCRRARVGNTADNVKHPPHYTAHPSGVECIQITEHMGFCLGNAVKYIWRAGLKGEELEDLKKARWYIDREIKRRGGA